MQLAESSCTIFLTSFPSLEPVGVDQQEWKLTTDVPLLLETSITLKADFPDLLLLPKFIVECKWLNWNEMDKKEFHFEN